MSFYYNGTEVSTIEQLEGLIAELAESEKTYLRNEFLGLPHTPVEASAEIVYPRQIRLALLGQGITAQMIEAAIDAMPEPQRSMALIEWEYTAYFERSHPLIPAVGAALGLSEEGIDQLWAYASTL